MKKFLSLVLALVMTMSLVTISSSAKDFTDDSKLNYKEAVDVISELGIVDGYADGAFNPGNTLTRGAAAKIICNMILGPTTASALATTTAPFKDVPTSNTFSGYIAYCSANGIISGYADGTFRPSGTLTGYAFLKMLLGALGYDAVIETYVGNNWSVQVAKQASSLKLTKGNSGFKGTDAINREEACLYAFNTMKATMVDYDTKGQTITVNGAVIATGASKAEKVPHDNDSGYKKNGGNDAYMQFCEQYFDKLMLVSSSSDAFGRPAHKWYKDTKVADKNLIGTYADDAELVYTADVKGTVLADDIDDAGLELNADGTVDVVRNGGDVNTYSKADVAAALKSTTKLGGKGIALEVYANDDDEITQVVVIVTYLAKVTSVTKDKTSTKSIDERALALSYTDAKGAAQTISAKAEDDVIGFDAAYEAVAKDDYVLIVPKGDNDSSTEVVSIAVPETATGAVTRTSTSAVTIGGSAYDIAKVVTTAPFGLTSKDATVYLDEYGYAIGYSGATSSGDKAVAVLKVYKSLNADDELVDMIKGVTSDGETVTWEYKGSPEKNKVYTYEEDDDVYTLTAATDSKFADTKTVSLGEKTLTTSTKSLSDGTSKAYFADDVKFIFVSDGKATVKDGVQKVNAANVYATIDVDGSTNYITALYVLGTTSASSTSSDEIVFVVGKTTPGEVQITVDKKEKTFKSYTAYINGEKVDDFYALSNSNINETGKSKFYSVEVDDDYGNYVLTGNEYTTSTGKLSVLTGLTIEKNASSAGNVVTFNSEDYDLTNAVIVDTTSVGNDVDSVSLLKDAIKAGTVSVSMIYNEDSNMVDYLYILGYTAF